MIDEGMTTEELVELATKLDQYRTDNSQEAEEAKGPEARVGSSLLAMITMKNPLAMTMSEELVSLAKFMFWLGYYSKATRIEVPEVYKNGFSGDPE